MTHEKMTQEKMTQKNTNAGQNRQNNRHGRTKRKDNQDQIITKKYCDRCDRLFRDCICDEIEMPERRQHRRTTK